MALQETSDGQVPAILGTNSTGDGVVGRGRRGIVGESDTYQGVYGRSVENAGVVGESDRLHGVFGICRNQNGGAVYGTNDTGFGLIGVAKSGTGVSGESVSGDGVRGRGRRGVVGLSDTYQGVFGKSGDNAGVVGESDRLHGVYGVCHNPNGGGLYGTNDNGGYGLVCDSPNGIGLATSGGRLAARFTGDIEVTGDVRLLRGDCAELFDAAPGVEAPPGTVMVLDDDGQLVPCTTEYDSRVVGVISGTETYRPGLILDCEHRSPQSRPVAIAGKVMCRVDATQRAVRPGDLLTTSRRTGHAVVVEDRIAAVGAVIGKALSPLRPGTSSLVPMLVVLQ